MNTQINTLNTTSKKPVLLRTIFILNALKLILAFTFFVVFSNKPEGAVSFDPLYILYTAIAYTLLFAGIVGSILKKNIWVMRILIIIDFLVSIPTTAVIGFAISIISLGLSFTGQVKRYFAAE